MDLRIGIIHTAKELDIELAEGTDREKVKGDVESALADPEGVLWVTDKRGREFAVPTSRIAYVEVGGETAERRVGFGAP